MAAPDPIRGTFWAGEAPPPIVLRLVADDGVALKLIDAVYGVETIALKLYCVDDAAETALFSASYNVAAMTAKVFQELQTDGYAFDEIGYNVRLVLTAAEFAPCRGGRDYVLDMVVTPTAQPVQKHVIWYRCVGSGL